MDRRYLSDRVPQLDLHWRDEKTFLEKLWNAFPDKRSAREVVPVLAWILCEALGEDPAEMLSLFTQETHGLILSDGLIVRDKGVDDVVRAILRDQLQLPPRGFEVKYEPTLDRIAALIAAAIAAFVSSEVLAEQAVVL